MNQEETWLLKEKYGGVESDMSAAQVEAFRADCARLVKGEPLGYVIGHVPFLDCKIWLDSHHLIPRPETEFWVDKAITSIKQYPAILSSVIAGNEAIQSNTDNPGLPRSARNDKMVRILDLCAGSGAIGVAVAKAVTKAEITFAEIDPTHLPTIQKNLTVNTSIFRNEKRHIIISDLFENVSGQFDFILTNPPYIDMAANTVNDSVVNHEPHLALFGGVAGMEIIERIINEAPKHLNSNGQLWLEHEPEQIEAITNLAQLNGFIINNHLDQYKIPRFSVLAMAQ